MSSIQYLRRGAASLCAGVALLTSFAAAAEEPGRGLTARFEVEFMQFTVDHHFAALRMTELAAGTDTRRDGNMSAAEGTSPTPGFGATPAKATLDDLKSLARRNNRMQREEIMTLRRFLRDWYGIDYQPRIRGDARAMINVLEQSRPGADFNHDFYEVFSRHHFSLMQPVNACMAGTELRHNDLRRECRSMWHSQTADIDMMRHELERHFGIADYQPFRGREALEQSSEGLRGQHSGGDHRH